MSQMTVPEFLERLDALPDSLMITQKHVAAIICVSESFLEHKRVKGGYLKYVVLGKGAIRYRLGDVRELLAGRVVGSTAEAQKLGLSAFMALPTLAGAAYRPFLLPSAVIDGRIESFVETMEQDVDEIIWTLPAEYQDRAERLVETMRKQGTESDLQSAIAAARPDLKTTKPQKRRGPKV